MSKKTVFIPDMIDEKLALKILVNELLSPDYIYCDTTCSEKQANALIVKDILLKHTTTEVKLLDGKVYGD